MVKVIHILNSKQEFWIQTKKKRKKKKKKRKKISCMETNKRDYTG
jgi:hypothetical protein